MYLKQTQTDEQRAILCDLKLREILERIYEGGDREEWPAKIIVPRQLFIVLTNHPESMFWADLVIKIGTLWYKEASGAELSSEPYATEYITFEWVLEERVKMSYVRYDSEAW